MATADQNLMEKIHLALGEELLARIKSGEATAAELNVARQWLKDNGIEALPQTNPHMMKIAGDLPFNEDDERQALPA